MIRAALFFLLSNAAMATACETPICQVNPDSLALTQIITFEDQPATMGPGRPLDEFLVLPGASFAERFIGQSLEFTGNHDRVVGPAANPLGLMAGQAGQNMSLVIMGQNRVLNGYGPAGYPRRNAQGEGAISVLFDQDQPALAFDLRGGENGFARVQFLRRDGSVIVEIAVQNLGEYAVGFRRQNDEPDIAGFVVMNIDPQGLAIDNIRFGPPPNLS